jgi:hypothetical protein
MRRWPSHCIAAETGKAPLAARLPPPVTLLAGFSRETGDGKHLGANITLVHGIFATSTMELDAFFTTL